MPAKRAERAVVTTSLRNNFTRCRKRYDFNVLQRLEPVVTTPPLRFGSLIHECLAAFYETKQPMFSGLIETWRQEYLREAEQAQPDAPPELRVDEEKVNELAKLAKGMMVHYVDKRGNDHDKWEVLAVEQPFRFPLHVPCSSCGGDGFDGSSSTEGDTNCAQCNGTGLGRRSPHWDFGGIIDLVVRVRETGRIYVVEHKTTAEKDPDNFARKLAWDAQPRGYVWAARQIHGECDGIIYNLLRKKVPEEPPTTQCKKCKGKGCGTCAGTGVGGVSKAKTDTTVELYAKALARYPHVDAASYEDVLSALTARGDTFLHRKTVFVSDRDLVEWEREMYEVTREMKTSRFFYRNLEACNAPGRICPYRSLCLEDNPLARRNFKQRETELTADVHKAAALPF